MDYTIKLSDEYNLLFKKSKAFTDRHRKVFALNRNSAGFSQTTKEITFTPVVSHCEGAYVYDLDGNKLLDLTMGFGVHFFGHRFPPITQRLEKVVKEGFCVGPVSPKAAELAKEISELTGVERVSFFNSGTEAVMVAIRLAKAATGKKYFVFFKGAYHGTFDPFLTLRADAQTHTAKEMIPGVTQNMLNESFYLDYGMEESYKFIEEHAEKIAAVITEPAQSRRPDFQPVEFLKKLRTLTAEKNIALIFDEVITGFRIHPGGAQAYFGIQADIVTYGKVIGGGMPIGIMAGKKKYLDYTDGGEWNFGDDSAPKSKITFVAGTFCHHPLAMETALEIVKLMKESKGKWQEELNLKTKALCEELNVFFSSVQVDIQCVYFASLFRFNTKGNGKFLFYELLKRGVYIWEGRNCFLSTAHTNEDLEFLVQKVKESVIAMLENEVIKGGRTLV